MNSTGSLSNVSTSFSVTNIMGTNVSVKIFSTYGLSFSIVFYMRIEAATNLMAKLRVLDPTNASLR